MKPKAALAGSVLVFVVNVIMTALVLPSDVPVFFMPGSQPDVYVPRALYLIGTLAGVLVAAIAVSRTAAVLLKFYLYGTKSQSIGSEAGAFLCPIPIILGASADRKSTRLNSSH